MKAERIIAGLLAAGAVVALLFAALDYGAGDTSGAFWNLALAGLCWFAGWVTAS